MVVITKLRCKDLVFVLSNRNEILKDELDSSPVKGFLVKSTLWSK